MFKLYSKFIKLIQVGGFDAHPYLSLCMLSTPCNFFISFVEGMGHLIGRNDEA